MSATRERQIEVLAWKLRHSDHEHRYRDDYWNLTARDLIDSGGVSVDVPLSNVERLRQLMMGCKRGTAYLSRHDVVKYLDSQGVVAPEVE